MLFGFNPFIYKAFGAFLYFSILVPPILLFIGNNGRLGIPEYVLDKRVSQKIGAEIWRIKPDGTEELIGVFKKENNIERFYKIK